jgi:hypothetical protein
MNEEINALKMKNTYDSFMNKEWSKMNLCKTWRKCKCPNKRLFRKKQKNLKNNEKKYMDKDYSENQVIEMHYVEHFIMSLIINKLI